MTTLTDPPRAQQVDDNAWERVQSALADPRWDFRTISGLAKAANLSEEEVEMLLGAHRDEVRQSAVPDRHGRALFTVSSRPKKMRELLAEIRAYLAGSVS
jgi:hypothetical protein